MKKILIIAGLVWLWFWWKKRSATAAAPTAVKAAAIGGSVTGSASAVALPVAPAIETHKAGLEVLRLHGNITDRGNIQRLTADVSPADANGLNIGDTVSLVQSNFYRGYYKIEDIIENGDIRSIVMDTRFLGSENSTYLSTEKTFVSGFRGYVNKKSAFR